MTTTDEIIKVYSKKICNWCGGKLKLKSKHYEWFGLVKIYQCENEECGHTIAVVDVTKTEFRGS